MAAAVIVTLQMSVPVHPPPVQPLKMEPAEGEAINVTIVPFGKADEQVSPHVMPAGLLVTVPLPAPLLLTFSWKLVSKAL